MGGLVAAFFFTTGPVAVVLALIAETDMLRETCGLILGVGLASALPCAEEAIGGFEPGPFITAFTTGVVLTLIAETD